MSTLQELLIQLKVTMLETIHQLHRWLQHIQQRFMMEILQSCMDSSSDTLSLRCVIVLFTTVDFIKELYANYF